MTKQFNYRMIDVSYHRGPINHQLVAQSLPDARVAYVKASDGYHMPDLNNKYDYAADRHTDARFVENFNGFRSVGWMVIPYHFVRWDMPWRAKRSVIVGNNLEYFQKATEPVEGQFKTIVLDMEQSKAQLAAAGLSKGTITNMGIEIVTKFLNHYDHVITYTASWWWNDMIKKPEWFGERMALIEAEYVNISGNMPGPFAKPSVSNGWSNLMTDNPSRLKGNLFAWQFSNMGIVSGIEGNTDLNGLNMKKSDLSDMTGQEIQIDPPPPVPVPGDPSAGAISVLDDLDDFSNDQRERYN